MGSEPAEPVCIGCGEQNYVAHRVAICAACVTVARNAQNCVLVQYPDGMRWVVNTKRREFARQVAHYVELCEQADREGVCRPMPPLYDP